MHVKCLTSCHFRLLNTPYSTHALHFQPRRGSLHNYILLAYRFSLCTWRSGKNRWWLDRRMGNGLNLSVAFVPSLSSWDIYLYSIESSLANQSNNCPTFCFLLDCDSFTSKTDIYKQYNCLAKRTAKHSSLVLFFSFHRSYIMIYTDVHDSLND